MPLQVIFKNNDTLIRVEGLKDGKEGGAFLNGATVTANLFDSVGGAIGGPVTLAYVAASDGIYEGVVESTLGLAAGDKVRVVIDAISGSLVAEWDFIVDVEKRDA